MDSKTKKIITEKWIDAFPELGIYAQNKLYKIIGPFICGIELINLPRSENYRPHFVIYSLWKTDLKTCLQYPIVMFEFYDKRKIQLSLPYDDIYKKYKGAQDIISNDLMISLEGNLKLDNFYRFIENIFLNDNTYNSHSGKIASLFELKFHVALYAGNQVQLQNILNQIQQSSLNWNMEIFETWFGNFDLWLDNLYKETSRKTEFLKKVELNKNDKKLIRIKKSEFIE